MPVRKPSDGQVPLTVTTSISTTDTIDLRGSKSFMLLLNSPSGAAVTVYAPLFVNGSKDIPDNLADLNSVTGITWEPVNVFGPAGDWKAATVPFVDAEFNAAPALALSLEIIRVVVSTATTGAVIGSAK